MPLEESKRLRFIDLARSVAILMMLQGHFISLTYSGYHDRHAELTTEGFSSNFFFDIWFQLRSLTAPMFFTVTGLVFVYLLLAHPNESFFRQKRVKKGIRRGFYIVLWGYLLQLNYQNLSYYLSGRINDRFFAFHVLQSIGFSILVLLLIYGLYRFVRNCVSLHWVLFAIGVGVFLLNPILKSTDGYFPAGVHRMIQNMFHGPESFFPLVPWIGFVCTGGAIGAYIRKDRSIIRSKRFIIQFILFGSAVSGLGIATCYLLDGVNSIDFWTYKGPFIQLFFMFLILGFLMRLEPRLKSSESLMMRIGQNTLFIYIFHAMILYGALIGIGLRSWIDKSLSFPMAVLGAILFLGFFALLIHWLPYYERFKQRILTKRRRKSDTTALPDQ